MNRVQTFSDFHRISDEWKPLLTTVNTIEDAADYINFPHEDYPDFVDDTLTTLKEVIVWLKNGDLREGDIKSIHQMCMKGKEYLKLGEYRGSTVIVGGNFEPPQPYLIPQMMMSICPVGVDTEDIVDWYKKFETIHPFEDGNGRVGGIILAAISYLNNGSYIVSKREYHHFIDLILNRINDEDDVLLNNKKYFDQTFDFNQRSIQYIIGKMNGIKFRTILDETNYRDEVIKLAYDNNINEIKIILNKIRKL